MSDCYFPLFRTTEPPLGNFDRAQRLFAGPTPPGHEDSCPANPTIGNFETAITKLEGGSEGVATASGQAAIHLALEPLVNRGDNFLASSKLHGDTTALFATAFAKYGVESRQFNPADSQSAADRLDGKTRFIFVETIANPDGTIPDFEELAALARKNKIPLIVDNTLATPYLFKPLAHGANIVIHATTGYLNGHGNATGGIIVDGGNFDWKKEYNAPDGKPQQKTYAARVRQALAVFGACLSPDNAALTLTGLKTLDLRMEAHINNAQLVAEWLANRKEIACVLYPGLRADPNHRAAEKYLPKGAGAVLLFTLKGGESAAKTVLHNLRSVQHMATIGQTGSTVIHPETTTHSQNPVRLRRNAEIYPGTLRLSVGIEEPTKLIGDLKQALEKTPKCMPA